MPSSDSAVKAVLAFSMLQERLLPDEEPAEAVATAFDLRGSFDGSLLCSLWFLPVLLDVL